MQRAAGTLSGREYERRLQELEEEAGPPAARAADGAKECSPHPQRLLCYTCPGHSGAGHFLHLWPRVATPTPLPGGSLRALAHCGDRRCRGPAGRSRGGRRSLCSCRCARSPARPSRRALLPRAAVGALPACRVSRGPCVAHQPRAHRSLPGRRRALLRAGCTRHAALPRDRASRAGRFRRRRSRRWKRTASAGQTRARACRASPGTRSARGTSERAHAGKRRASGGGGGEGPDKEDNATRFTPRLI
jgi:hypothetical protein